MIDLPLKGAGGAPAAPSPPPERLRPRRLPARVAALLVALISVAAIALVVLFWPAPPRAVLSAERLDFGPRAFVAEPDPLELTVGNEGERALRVAAVAVQGEAAAEYSLAADGCTGAELPGGAVCGVQILFSPAVIGPRAARLAIESNAANAPLAVELAGDGRAALLAAQPQSLEFSPQPVGEAGPSRPLRLANEGNEPLRIRAVGLEGAGADDFTLVANRCSGRTLEPGRSCEVALAFAPQTAGERTASLAVRSDSAVEPPAVTLAGSARAAEAVLEFAPSAVEFGRSLLGVPSAPRAVRVSNPGSRPLALGRAAVVEGASFALADDGCGGGTVQPGGSCSLSVLFRPAAVGPVAGRLAFERPGGGLLPWELGLAGVGVEARLVVAPGRHDYGSLRSGREAGLSVRVRNAGELATGVREVVLGGAGRSAFEVRDDRCSGRELEPGGACSIEVVYRARGEGGSKASLRVRAEAARAEWGVELSAAATAPRLETEPGSLAFGPAPVGTFLDRRLRLESAGSAVLELGELRTAGEAASEFRLIEGECGRLSLLEPGASCVLGVRFWPAGIGPREAELVLKARDGPESWRVALAGVGLPPPPPGIAVSPGRVDFGALPVGSRSGIQTVRVSNPGAGRLVLRGFELAGPAAADYRIVPGTCEGSPYVASRADCSLGLRFSPGAAGRRSARLLIRHNAAGGELAIPLTGSGAG